MYSFIKNKKNDWKITIEDIRNVEGKYEIQFPEKLVEFLLDYNGVEIFLSRIVKKDITYEVDVLIPIKYGKLPIEKIMEWDRMDGFIGDDLIPIASDQGGNTYYLNSNNGKILLYYSDDYDNPKLISEDFQSFLSSMVVYKKEG